MMAGDFIAVALSEELEDRKAALPARNGSNAVAGLAIHIVSFASQGALKVTATDLAAPLRRQTVLSTAFRRQTQRKRGGWRSGE